MAYLIKELFFNATILISFITLGNHYFREKIATPFSPLHRKVITGFFTGIIGCLLMFFGVPVVGDVVFDLRPLPVIMMALYSSFPSALVTATVIAAFRIIYFGLNLSSATAVFTIFSMAVVCGFIGRSKLKITIKWILSVSAVNVIVSIITFILISDFMLAAKVSLAFAIITVISALALYHLLENITKFNLELRRNSDDAKKDYLTGLNNVRQFDILLQNSISEATRKNEEFSFLFLDIDFFKKVNDTYGHSEGDIVLKELSGILKDNCRSYDIISRNGGEEFSVILLGSGVKRAMEIAERIRINVEDKVFTLSDGTPIKITISIGVSSYPKPTENAYKLYEQADKALYKAKQQGRNRVMLI